MIWTVPVLLGVGCGLTLWSVRDPDARLLALSLCGFLVMGGVFWYHDAMWGFPVMDWLLGVVSLVIWWSRREAWVALFVQLIAIRLIMHVLDTITGHAFVVPYIHALNATFALLLVVTASSGGRLNGSVLLRGLHRLRRVLSQAASARRLR